jgi:hypothetical protein
MSQFLMSEKRMSAKPATKGAEVKVRIKTAPLHGRSGFAAKAEAVSSAENNRSHADDAQFYLAAMTYFFADQPGNGVVTRRELARTAR